jgi:hypothetical protein
MGVLKAHITGGTAGTRMWLLLRGEGQDDARAYLQAEKAAIIRNFLADFGRAIC